MRKIYKLCLLTLFLFGTQAIYAQDVLNKTQLGGIANYIQQRSSTSNQKTDGSSKLKVSAKENLSVKINFQSN